MKSYFDYNDKSLCCGCSACYNVCPKKAITMIPDALGFLYPKIQNDKCINCNLCRQVCSFNADYDKSDNISPIFYAARHKDINEILKSRSGAVFVALSDFVLDNNGVVYGVGFKEHFKVCHKRAINKEQRDEFRGSKYVQSDLENIFENVLDDLQNQKYVLFSGTGCQIAGIKSYLKIKHVDISKLFLVDIVCHGVPSPFFWSDYLNFIENKYKKKIISVNFRDKKFGWREHKESFVFNNSSISANIFTYAFFQHIMLRHSCEKCFFTNTERPSDITIADFWGWEKVDDKFNIDNKGVSLVIVNTQKGDALFNNIKKKLNFIKTEREKCLQPHLIEPSTLNPDRELFERDYMEKGFLYVLKKYCNYGFWNKLKTTPKQILKKINYHVIRIHKGK